MIMPILGQEQGSAELDGIGDLLAKGSTSAPATGPGPMMITAVGSVRWSVWLNGVKQTPEHNDQLEAMQHADSLRYKNRKAKIEIRHVAVYNVT